ncbi:MAG: hypothetical protein IJS60_04240 [Abditibacteriota bacterium]|nr:hypothetical protein [Abditibacteriota bacterium]
MKLPDLNLITEVLFRGEEIAQLKGLENNTPICVLIALLEEKDSYAVKVLQRFGCDVEKLHDNLFNSIKQENRKFETRFLDPGTNLLLKTSRELTLSKKEKSVSHITLLETFLIRGFGLDEFWKQVNVNTEELIKYISEDKSDNHPHKSPRPFEAPVDPFIHDTDDLFDPFDEDLPPHERDVRARRNKKRRRAIDTFSVDLVSLA